MSFVCGLLPGLPLCPDDPSVTSSSVSATAALPTLDPADSAREARESQRQANEEARREAEEARREAEEERRREDEEDEDEEEEEEDEEEISSTSVLSTSSESSSTLLTSSSVISTRSITSSTPTSISSSTLSSSSIPETSESGRMVTMPRQGQPLTTDTESVSLTRLSRFPTDAAASGSSSASPADSSETTKIAGAAVGGIAAIVLLAILFWYWRKGRSANKAELPEPLGSTDDIIRAGRLTPPPASMQETYAVPPMNNLGRRMTFSGLELPPALYSGNQTMPARSYGPPRASYQQPQWSPAPMEERLASPYAPANTPIASPVKRLPTLPPVIDPPAAEGRYSFVDGLLDQGYKQNNLARSDTVRKPGAMPYD